MKKGLGYLFFFLAITVFVGCESDSDPDDVCKQSTITCDIGDVTSCCEVGGDCYFIVDGKKYATQDDLNAVCSPNAGIQELKLIKLQLDAETKLLLQEVRASAICQ